MNASAPAGTHPVPVRHEAMTLATAGREPPQRPLPRLPTGFAAALADDVEWLRRHQRHGDPVPHLPHRSTYEIALTLSIAGAVLLALLAGLYVLSLVVAPRPELVPTLHAPDVRQADGNVGTTPP